MHVFTIEVHVQPWMIFIHRHSLSFWLVMCTSSVVIITFKPLSLSNTQRYFVLERGVLYFSRSQAGIAKGKALGSLDLGMAFVHADGSSRRIDIDGEHVVVHLKVSIVSLFYRAEITFCNNSYVIIYNLHKSIIMSRATGPCVYYNVPYNSGVNGYVWACACTCQGSFGYFTSICRTRTTRTFRGLLRP